jgi:phosphoribosylanthranilate isomerase
MSNLYARPRVKICCITDPMEAELAIEHGAEVLGLVGPMPSGPGVISMAMAQQINWSVGPMLTFLLTSETEAESIIAQCRAAGTNCVQIVDAVSFEVYQEIRAALPYIKIIQVLHVTSERDIIDAQLLDPVVDALLLDSGNPHLEVKELGGTGRVHNWEISRRIVDAVQKPVFLAGGLTPENIQSALHQVRPYGIDVCSGVRTEGKLDPIKLASFMSAVATFSPKG